MAKIVSIINLKGGVGKTTTTVALAEFLAYEHNKKVLVVDLDPQTNATVMLIEQNMWKQAKDEKKTIYNMFKDKLDGTSHFNINKSIIKKVSNIRNGIENLHLLPSSLDLIDIQDEVPLIGSIEDLPQSPMTVLSSYLTDKIIESYDYILIDCPPNLGLITLNGIYISDYYLMPVIPDILSTYGISQTIDRIAKVSTKIRAVNRNYKINPLGIVITKYRQVDKMHKRIAKDLRERSGLSLEDRSAVPPIFEAVVKESNTISEITDIFQTVNTLKQKYNNQNGIYDSYSSITKEFIERIEK